MLKLSGLLVNFARFSTSPVLRLMSTRPSNAADRVKWSQELFRKSRIVCFDVDSTVSTEEGIDVMAEAHGKYKEVAAWTSKAMGGTVPFEVAIKARLDIIKPHQSTLQKLLDEHAFPCTKGMKSLIVELQKQGKHIYFISGGLLQMVEPIGVKMGIDKDHIYAIKLFFNEDGSYKGFDTDAYTAWSNGKQKAVQAIKNRHMNDNEPIIMIGDGATDMEARAVADTVIGFGQNAVRESVKRDADWFVMHADELLEIIKPYR